MSIRYFFWGLLVCVALGFSLPSVAEEPAGVSEEAYAELMANEVLDLQDLAEGAEIQRRMFNRITPSGFSWFQPMFPSVAPFDAKYFDGSFLDGLLGEDTNSVAVYPLSLVLDPKTRETLVYNAEGKLIATVPSDGVSRTWPEDADPARVTLKIDLLPSEDVEPFLYVEDRVEESLASVASKSAKTPKAGGIGMMSMMVSNSNFGILDFQRLTNGNMQLTVTNGTNVNVAEVFTYTVWHTSSVYVATWTNEESNVVTSTNTLWNPSSPPFNGLESEWDFGTTNLVLTNGGGTWEDSNISSNARVRFYGAAERGDYDGDGLTDGAEKFVCHTDPGNPDTDGDGWSDGEENAAETDPLDRFSATHLAKGVVINEVLYDATGLDLGKEWVELYSAGRYPVDIGGFVIQVGDLIFTNAFTIPSNTWVDPGTYLLLGGSQVTNHDLEVDFTMPNRFTNDATAGVRLAAEVGTNTFVADCLMYGGNETNFNQNGLDTTGWISTNALSAGAAKSLVRLFVGHDTDQVLDWRWTNMPTTNSASETPDSDGDGLTDQEELTASSNVFDEATNPLNIDSDGDGLTDYQECITYETNPNTWATDGDLFPWPPTNNYAVSNWWGSDSYELANGWDPLIYDENTNGIPDSWEMAFPGTNLYADTDNDGILNYDELVQNSNPFSSNSVSPQPYVVVYQSSKPGWVNNGLVDVGLNGWVKIYFSGLKTNTCLGVWVKECSTQEEFKVEWFDATLNGSVWLNENREVITSASAEANSHPYLLIQDLGLHPDFAATLGGEYTNAIVMLEFTNRIGKINYGYDPKECLKSETPWPWTSVGRNGTNDVCKLLVEPAAIADQFEIVMSVGSDRATVTPTNLVSGSTDLTITGQGMAGWAVAEARLKGTSAAMAKLNILSQTNQTLTVGIYFIQDDNSTNSIPTEWPLASSVISSLNDIYSQAQISWQLAIATTTNYPYDSSGYGTNYDGIFQQDEIQAIDLNSAAGWSADLNILFIKKSGIPYTPNPPLDAYFTRGVALIYSDTYEEFGGIIFTVDASGYADLGVAHEFGHNLGLPKIGDPSAHYHDSPPWPTGEQSLMRDGWPESDGLGGYTLPVPGRWLRHEDWKESNDASGGY